MYILCTFVKRQKLTKILVQHVLTVHLCIHSSDSLHTSYCSHIFVFLPACASEQGNVIGLVSVHIYVYKKIVIERNRDLIYLKFVATDFSLKIISPNAGENSGDSA